MAIRLGPRKQGQGKTAHTALSYTGEPIYFYMIGKNAGPNQVLVNENYQL